MNSNHMFLVPLKDTITIVEQTDAVPDIDEWGVPTYEEVTNVYPCHIAYNCKQESITIGKGTVFVYTAKIYLRGLVGIEKLDKIMFDDMMGKTVEKEVQAVYPVRDFGGKVLATCLIV